MFIFDNFLDKDTCDYYKNIVASNYKAKCDQGYDPLDFWKTRNVRLENDPILPKVKQFLESKIKVKLNCFEYEMQTWPMDITLGRLHIHDSRGDYNSLLYLNDDFEGGEFITNTGITVKPVQGRLTFFNGSKIFHGVRPIYMRHRYTIIFWWTDTIFYD